MTNKKQMRKQLLLNSQAIHAILAKATATGPLPLADVEKVNKLMAESNMLRSILHPRSNVPSATSIQKDVLLREIEVKYVQAQNNRLMVT